MGDGSKPSGDGGKGSVRRNEDTDKVLEGFTRIFGESKLDKRLREEREAMEDIDEYDYEQSEDEEEEAMCNFCNGTGEGQYDGSSCSKCHGTGMMPKDGEEDDYY